MDMDSTPARRQTGRHFRYISNIKIYNGEYSMPQASSENTSHSRIYIFPWLMPCAFWKHRFEFINLFLMLDLRVILAEIYKYGAESRHNSWNLILHQRRHWSSGEIREDGEREREAEMINQKIGKLPSGGWEMRRGDEVLAHSAIFEWVCRLLWS